MRKAVIALVLSMGLLVAGVVPGAQAATTRAEYIAQVDPICQSFVAPVNNAASAYHRNVKRWVHSLFHGSLKGWVKQTRKTARSLRAFNQVQVSLTDQIAAVPPVASDAGTVSTWLNFRRQAEASAAAAAASFSRFKFDRSDKQLHQADLARSASVGAIAGFGFQVCGVSV